MNPELDIGQVEGAYTMGLGLWLTEKIIYDPQTGKNLTNGTWVSDLVLSRFSTITFHEKSFTLQKSAGDMNALAEVVLLCKSENLRTRKALVI